jgi:Fic family protein
MIQDIKEDNKEKKIHYHKPSKLSQSGMILDLNKFGENLSRADYALGVLEGSQRHLRNSSLLISPLTAKEAAVSSRIEGTQSSVSDVFLYEAGGKPKYSDTVEVINYRKAMNFAIGELERGRAISSSLIKTLHQILLDGARHKGTPGKFRDGQVWIGEKFGDPIEKAIYVPPEPIFVDEYIDNLISYLQNSNERPLVKAAMAHYQFEAVHPFEDGNGRIGRLLIPLILYEKRKISSPILYISGYLEKYREDYLEALHMVDKGGTYEDWLNFFFSCTIKQIEDTQKMIESIYGLYDDVKNKFKINKSPYILPFIDFIFESPIFSIPKIMERLECSSWLTAKNLIKIFQKEKLIVELSKDGKAKLYGFLPLLKILS